MSFLSFKQLVLTRIHQQVPLRTYSLLLQLVHHRQHVLLTLHRVLGQVLQRPHHLRRSRSRRAKLLCVLPRLFKSLYVDRIESLALLASAHQLQVRPLRRSVAYLNRHLLHQLERHVQLSVLATLNVTRHGPRILPVDHNLIHRTSCLERYHLLDRLGHFLRNLIIQRQVLIVQTTLVHRQSSHFRLGRHDRLDKILEALLRRAHADESTFIMRIAYNCYLPLSKRTHT